MAVLPAHLKELKPIFVKNGFIKPEFKKLYSKNDKGEYGLGGGNEINEDHADFENTEEVNQGYLDTDYPKPTRRFRLVIESASATIEEPYFWILEHARQDFSHPFVEKITDTYSASEQSAFWGAVQSRVGIQQDRAAQYLKGTSEMIKQLFQLVRELRILDEKLEPRNRWGKDKEKSDGGHAADMALKGEYTDLVENRGGQVQPGSIYHLSQTVGYVALPDMFFNTRIYKLDDIDKDVEAQWGKYNTNIKNVLKRKMFAFINWKLKTDAELKTRRTFTLRYLRQHWNTIKMYMNWIKPYLRNIERMQMNQRDVDSPDLIGAFETSTIEIEFLAYKKATNTIHPCALFTFKFRTRPDLSFQKDQYAHKGPIHIGRIEISMRAYGWSKEEIENYKKVRNQEDMKLLGMVDTSVKDAMEALGGDLEKYLSEAGEKDFLEKKKEEDAAKKKKEADAMRQSENMLDPFIAIFKGFAELGGSFTGPMGSKSSGGSNSAPSKKAIDDARKNMGNEAAKQMFNVYKNFKKSHGLLSW